MSPTRATVTNILSPLSPGTARLLAGNHRIARAYPLVPAAAQRAHVLHAAFLQHERRTGARELIPSRAVDDDRLARFLEHGDGLFILVGPGQAPFERQRQGAFHAA